MINNSPAPNCGLYHTPCNLGNENNIEAKERDCSNLKEGARYISPYSERKNEKKFKREQFSGIH